MKNVIQELIDQISEQNILQGKFLRSSMDEAKEEHIQGLEKLISFYATQGVSVSELAKAYLNFVDFFMEERMYFFEHNAYRYSSYAETAQLYENKIYMESYMLGLSLSIYLMKLQRDNMDFFVRYCQALQSSQDRRLLEVGTGHGVYFATAINHTNFGKYTGIDISPTSVDLTRKFAAYTISDPSKNYEIIQKDFFTFDQNDTFDAIIMGEILEHVEQPGTFLEKARDLASDDASIYVSTAINSPYPDHIYLFRSVDEVRELFQKSGLAVVDEIIITPNGISMEKAIAKKYDIVVAFTLKKN